MARPIKDGLDYFPLNTVLDDKFELLEAKYGIEGFAIIIKVYQLIYREHGYFYPWGEREQLLISRRVNVDNNRVNAIIMYAVEIGIFDAEMFDRGVLTSHGIQKRYIEASKRRYSLTLYQDLLLVNVDNIPVNVGKNPRCIVLNAYNNPQIERKEKGKERKEKRKESTYMRAPENPISIPKPPDPAPVPKEEPEDAGKIMMRHDDIMTHHEYQPTNQPTIPEKEPARSRLPAYGKLKNVYLSDKEYRTISKDYGPWTRDDYIDRLSLWKPNASRRVKNDYATLLNWLRRDKIPIQSAENIAIMEGARNET